MFVIEQPIPPAPAADSEANVLVEWNAIYDAYNEVACRMLRKHPAKDDTCHHCKEVGHWKRNCPVYLADLLKKKKHVSRQGASYFITFTDDYSRYGYVYLLKHKHEDTPDKLQQRSVKCIFIGYPKETMGYYFYIPHENKIVVARYAEFFEKNLITQEVSGRAIDLEEIQDEDTSPSKITSQIPMEVEGFKPPQEEVIPIR
nr:zinc finger, CCHC-type [Tanacetum cinerariifolium]